MASYLPPPPYYEEGDRPPLPPRSKSNKFQVTRKPLPTNGAQQILSKDLVDYENSPYLGENHPQYPNITAPERPELPLKTSIPTNITNSAIFGSHDQTSSEGGTNSVFASPLSASRTNSFPSASETFVTTPDPSTSNQIQKAYQEAKFFAGGLISHPYESTKHFTILRHSHGLVFYQGSNTTLAISIFSDGPLPEDRTLWLQNKGWSGKTGMKLKSLVGRNGSWLDVTPTIGVSPEQLNPQDERAWQRDLYKFRKKAQAKVRDAHIVRETAIIRIPAEAGDGYFQVVMCSGEKGKVLCTSPVFRLLSTSRSPSSLRGASLSTLPLELGAMMLTTYATKSVETVVTPITSVVQGSVQKYMPSFWTREAATMAYGISAVGDKVDSILQSANGRDETREHALARIGHVDLALEEGPKAPYPIRITGCTQPGIPNMVEKLNMPVFLLTGVDESMMHKLDGNYFGWAKNREKSDEFEHTWNQAIVSIVPINVQKLTRVNIAKANQRVVTVRLVCNYEDVPSPSARFEIHILGFIRPDEPIQRANLERGIQDGDEAAHEAAMLCEVNDILVAQEILDHPSWSPEAVLPPKMQERKTSGFQRITDGYAYTRMAAQSQMDRVPLHKIGVRLEADKLRDQMIFANGFYVTR